MGMNLKKKKKVKETNFVLFSLVYFSSLFIFPFPHKILLSKRMLQIQRLVPPRAREKVKPLQPTTRIPARTLQMAYIKSFPTAILQV